MAPQPRRDGEKSDTSLGLKTKLRLEIVIPLMTAVVSFTMIYGKLIQMDKTMSHSWTIQHQIMWENQFSINNPTVKVPNAENIVSLMNQQSQP